MSEQKKKISLSLNKKKKKAEMQAATTASGSDRIATNQQAAIDQQAACDIPTPIEGPAPYNMNPLSQAKTAPLIELLKKVPGREYFEGDDDPKLTYTKMIKLFNEAFGPSGWSKKEIDVRYDHIKQSSKGYEAGCTMKIELEIRGVGNHEALSASKANSFIQTARLFGELTGNASFDKDVMAEIKKQPKPKKLKLDETLIFHAEE
ncbi:hypothetical protein O0I10_003676 [Lichtheimia ornata]|uniref:Uncharacterized protein n=1 Tax=Lichtheimia ornata TaxID=688661 RepID=A0AAD7V8M0_9FUNG|nr:uncharacterized protein O0I10_003676 [Lichtheimia ornata]KAJ8660628.1 hypothetical protein O0I10_003676 [Lichtheimia ornata]